MITIPNYELVEQIGESPQATIYRAYHKKNPGRLLTLKVLKSHVPVRQQEVSATAEN